MRTEATKCGPSRLSLHFSIALMPSKARRPPNRMFFNELAGHCGLQHGPSINSTEGALHNSSVLSPLLTPLNDIGGQLR